MKQKIMVALGAVCSGIVFSFLMPWIVLGGSQNYAVTSIMATAFAVMIIIPVGFLAGSFIGVMIPWFFLKKETGYDPYAVAGGAFGGAMLGIGLAYFCFLAVGQHTQTPVSSGFAPTLFRLTVWILSPVLSFGGAYWATRFRRKIPPSFLGRALHMSPGLIFPAALCFFLLGGYADYSGGRQGDSFPENSPLEVRHQWAVKKFGNNYLNAVEFVKRSKAIESDVGFNILTAPAAHSDNYFMQAPGDPGIAVFTLDVQGEKGKGICSQMNAGGMVGDNSQIEWRFGGKTIPLSADGSFDKARFDLDESIRKESEFRFDLDESIRKESEFRSRMAALFKRKEYQAVLNEFDSFLLHASHGISTPPELALMLAQSYEAVGRLKDAAQYYRLSGSEKDGGKKMKYLEKALQLELGMMSRIKTSYKNGYKETVRS